MGENQLMTFENHEEAWEELRERLSNFLWTLENGAVLDESIDNAQRIKDTKKIIEKMEFFEKGILKNRGIT